MYRKDKLLLIIIFGISSCLSFFGQADYMAIATMALTVVSISVAVYIAVASVLLGSDYAKTLNSRVDRHIPTMSQLGVLSEYLRHAEKTGIVTIIISCFFSGWNKTIENYIVLYPLFSTVFRIASSAYVGIFALNIFYLFRIFVFLVNSLNKT